MRQRSDVRAGGTFDDKAPDAPLDLLEPVLVNLDFDGLQLDTLFFARQLVRRPPFHLLRGKGWRHLFEPPNTLFGKLFDGRSIQRWRDRKSTRLNSSHT